MVKEGLRWRVGNGECIWVWEDKWLPLSSTFKVVSPNSFLHADIHVSELIDPTSANWKSTVIDALFLPHEAEIIKSSPLSVKLPEDKQIWAMSFNVQFSVHSAYSLAMSLSRVVNKGDTSDTS